MSGPSTTSIVIWGQQVLHCMQVVQHVSGGVLPARLAFAGYAEGGALAKVASVWAASAHPNAQTRCITFGAPRVGDTRCALPCCGVPLPSIRS